MTGDAVEVLGETSWQSCDIDLIGMIAADRLENAETHIAALRVKIGQLVEALRRADDA